MIIFKHYNDIDDDTMSRLNNFILSYFSHSRLFTYESVVYTINDNTQEITGFTGLQTLGNYININQLCVDITLRNQGIASNLLEYIEKRFQYNMILYIQKNTDNSECLYQFYSKKGFIEIYSDNIKYKMCKNIS
jgi:N-acetylglutamate synthase-like GNAT family acetyltransferase